jgi:hypothetical protein
VRLQDSKKIFTNFIIYSSYDQYHLATRTI